MTPLRALTSLLSFLVLTAAVHTQACTPSSVECTLDSNGQDPCCSGNKCQLDQNNTLRCMLQCTRLGKMCQPAAHVQYDDCCEGSRCAFSHNTQMYTCEEIKCVKEGGSCPGEYNAGCCEPTNCDNGVCTSSGQCVGEGQQCSLNGSPSCCDSWLSCHAQFYYPWQTVCQRQCAGFGEYCGSNTLCCSANCNSFTDTCY